MSEESGENRQTLGAAAAFGGFTPSATAESDRPEMRYVVVDGEQESGVQKDKGITLKARQGRQVSSPKIAAPSS